MAGRRGGAGGAPAGRPGRAPVPGVWPTSTGSVEWVPEHEDGAWTLYVNGVPSSPLRDGQPAVLDFEYLAWMADALDVWRPAPAPLSALHLGGGACALPRHLAAVRPGSRQVVVELDGELARRVREWVDLPRSPELKISVGDARERLERRPAASTEVLVRDVFAGDATPRHVSTAQFHAIAARVLAPGGLYLANVVESTSPVGVRAELAAARTAFSSVALASEPGVLRGRRHGNAVVLASDAPLPVAALTRRLSGGAAPARLVHGEALDAFVAGVSALADGDRSG